MKKTKEKKKKDAEEEKKEEAVVEPSNELVAITASGITAAEIISQEAPTDETVSESVEASSTEVRKRSAEFFFVFYDCPKHSSVFFKRSLKRSKQAVLCKVKLKVK